MPGNETKSLNSVEFWLSETILIYVSSTGLAKHATGLDKQSD